MIWCASYEEHINGNFILKWEATPEALDLALCHCVFMKGVRRTIPIYSMRHTNAGLPFGIKEDFKLIKRQMRKELADKIRELADSVYVSVD